MISFKGGWGKLYYTQHSLKRCETITHLFLRNKHTQKERGKEKKDNVKVKVLLQQKSNL